MSRPRVVPEYTLFGETEGFPDILHAERIRDRSQAENWVIAPHRHRNLAQILVVDDGSGDVRVDDATFRLGPGDLIYIPALIVHGFVFEANTDGLVLMIPTDILGSITALSGDLSIALGAPFHARLTPDLRTLLDILAKGLDSQGPLRRERIFGLTQAALASLAALRAVAMGDMHVSRGRLGDFDALLAEHIRDGWRASDYAGAMSITTGHLSRLCSEAAGISATAYVERAVMAEARRCLAFTRMSVAEIGYRLGYQDPAYFTRRFRKAVGVSPSAYRRSIAA